MRTVLAALFLAAGLLPAPASAAEGLAWKWDAPRRYQVRADVQLPEVLVFKKESNSDLRVAQFLIGVTTTCSPVEAMKRQWELACVIDDFQISAATTRSDAGKLQPVLDEIDEKLVGARVQLVHAADGRVKNVDLEGVDKSWRRASEMHETLRQVLLRAYAAFDLQLPKKGDDKGRAWRQTGTLVMGVPSEYGSMGQSEVDHQVTRVDGSVVEVASQGRGVVGAGEMIMVQPGAPERPRNMYDLTYQGVATFDLAQGALLERQYLVEGVPTASSLAAEGGGGVAYVQAVRLVHLPDGTEAPALGPNEETTAQ